MQVGYRGVFKAGRAGLLAHAVRRGLICACAALMAPMLAGCLPGSNTTGGVQAGRNSDSFQQVRAIDLSPGTSREAEKPPNQEEGAGAVTVYGRDDAVTTTATVRSQPGTKGDGYELNFENAPITTVAKVVLSEILGVGYTIDSRVQGTISLSSTRPVSKTDILFLLENALRLSNVVMVRDGGSYRLLPAGEAIGSGPVDNSPQPGYGITVVPLRFMSVQTVMKLLDSFANKPGMLRADQSRNLLLVQGNGAERRAAVETIASFDVDWMRGQSVGIYPLKNASLEAVILELDKILEAGEGGAQQNLIKFQPISRLNAILVVTRKADLLRTAGGWITRLDRADTVSTGVRVYRVKYGDAKQIASILNDVFAGRSSSGPDSSTNQIMPGSGVSSLASSPATTTPENTRAAPGQVASLGGSGGGNSSFDSRFSGTKPTTPSLGSRGGDSGGGGQGVMQGVRITADTSNNSLLIYANQENYKAIERTLVQIDRLPLQVSIDATIAEVTLNNSLSYGVQWYLKSKDLGYKEDRGSISLLGEAAKRLAPGFNLLLGPEKDPRFILDALRTLTDVKVLSTPSVVVVDNQFATLLVGDQVPITTRTAVGVDNVNAPLVSNIEYRNTGVILKVAPRINANGNILLEIEQEISNVAAGAGANSLTPTVSQRKIKSTIAVGTGQTVLLGGLIQERRNRGRSGIPLLESLQGIGDLFAHNDASISRTELVIFIRPQIIRNGADAQNVAEELRAKLQGSVDNTYPTPLGRR
jgi:general secretion pathway protein D